MIAHARLASFVSTSTAVLLAVGVLGAGVLGARPATGEPASPTAAVAPTANTPVPAIDAFHAGLLAIMKDAKQLGFQGRIEKLAPLMSRTFDLDFMASKTVGGKWAKLSAADKKRWIETFTRFTTANYAGRFKGYTGEQFVTLGVEEAGHGTKLVRTKIIVPNDAPVELNYRVVQKNGAWRVIDVYLNGKVSELALRRSEYTTALRRADFDHLIASVETKINDLKTKGRKDG